MVSSYLSEALVHTRPPSLGSLNQSLSQEPQSPLSWQESLGMASDWSCRDLALASVPTTPSGQPGP